MKITLDDPELGVRDINNNVELIQDQLKLLRHFKEKNSSPNPKLLEDDIRAYEIILSQPDVEKAVESYLSHRHEPGGKSLCKTKKQILIEMGIWK